MPLPRLPGSNPEHIEGLIVQRDTRSTAHFIAAPDHDDLQLLLHSGGFAKLLDRRGRPTISSSSTRPR